MSQRSSNNIKWRKNAFQIYHCQNIDWTKVYAIVETMMYKGFFVRNQLRKYPKGMCGQPPNTAPVKY